MFLFLKYINSLVVTAITQSACVNVSQATLRRSLVHVVCKSEGRSIFSIFSLKLTMFPRRRYKFVLFCRSVALLWMVLMLMWFRYSVTVWRSGIPPHYVRHGLKQREARFQRMHKYHSSWKPIGIRVFGVKSRDHYRPRSYLVEGLNFQVS